MEEFDIIEYIGTLTGYDIPVKTLKRIAIDRGVANVTNPRELTERDKDLITADQLFVVYTSPTQSGTLSKSHNGWSQSIGGRSITDKKNIYQHMMSLYKKWGENVLSLNGGCQWIE